MFKWIYAQNSQSNKPNSRTKANLAYGPLEPRQLLATTATFTGGEFTLTGDLGGDDFVIQVDSSNHLTWSENGGTPTDDLDNTDPGVQFYAMGNPATPISVTIEGKGGQDTVELDIGPNIGLKNVTVDGGANIDSLTIQSDLNLLPTGGKLDVKVEQNTIADNTFIAAPLGFTIKDPGFDGNITIGDNVTISTRAIATGGDHFTDPSIEDSANITLQSKEISVGDGTTFLADVEAGSIHTPADVTLDAQDQLASFLEFASLIDDLVAGTVSPLDALNFLDQEASAFIDLGTVEIRGKDIVLKAFAGGSSKMPTIGKIIKAINDPNISFLETAADFLDGQLNSMITSITDLPAFFAQERTVATIRIGQNSILDAASEVKITAKTLSAESVTVKSKYQAIAVMLSESTADIDIEEGVEIDAENKVEIKTSVDLSSTAKATTAKNLDPANSKERISFAFALARTDLNSTIFIAPNSNISAGTDVVIHAKGKQKVKSEASSSVYKDGGIGLVLAFSFPNANVAAEVEGNVTAFTGTPGFEDDHGISIIAELHTEEDSQAISGLGGETPKFKASLTKAKVKKFFTKKIKPILDHLKIQNLTNGTNVPIDFASALALNESDNDVLARVGGESNLYSNQDILVKSSLVSKMRTFAESTIDDKTADAGKENMISTAVVVGLYNNSSRAILDNGATADAKREIKVDATTTYPFKNPVSIIKKGSTRILKLKGNSWARSHSLNGKSTIAGSLNYQDYNTTTHAKIGSGANINQLPAAWDIDQSVKVSAATNFLLIDITGVFELDIVLAEVLNISSFWQTLRNDGLIDFSKALWKAVKKDIGSSDLGFGTDAKKTAVGGAWSFTDIFDDTEASIGANSNINAGLDGNVTVTATSKLNHLSFAASGGESEKTGIAGSFAHNRQISNTRAFIGHGSQVNGGKISIASNSDVNNFGFAGSAIRSGNSGFGVSIATNKITRSNLAYIGFPGEPMYESMFSAPGGLSVIAKSEGGFYANALSGVFPSKGTASNVAPSTTPTSPIPIPSNFVSKGKTGKFGLSVSADIAINNVQDDTQAFINDKGTFEAKDIAVTAKNKTPLIAVAGSAAINGKDNSVGLAGTYTHNILSGSAMAWIANSTIHTTTGGLSITSQREDGASLWSLNASAASAGKVEVAGNVSLNNANWITESALHFADVHSAAGATLSASDNSKVWSFAGAIDFSGKLGFSSSFSKNDLTTTTSTLVEGSQLELERDLSLIALNDAAITSVAGGFSNGEKLAVAGTIALNEINSNVSALLTDSSEVTAAAVSISATDESDIVAISGAATVAKGSGFVGSFSGNNVQQTVTAQINQSTTDATGSTSLTANSKGRIQSFAAGVSIQDQFAFAGSMAINNIQSTTSTKINQSDVETGGQLNVRAASNGTINAFSGNFGGVGSAAVGAAVSINNQNNTVESSIVESTVQAEEGSVTVSADTKSIIRSLAVGGAFAQAFALGGSVSTNNINSNTDAHITSTSLTAGSDVSVTASNQDTIKALTGGVAGASTAAVGAAVSVNKIDSNLRACIVDSVVTVGGDVEVSTSNQSEISSLAVGGAYAGTFALGGAVSINQIDVNSRACIMDDSVVTAGGDITVSSFDDSFIKALAPGIGISGTAAVGIAVVDNDINRTVQSTISNSSATAGGDVSTTVEVKSLQNGIAIGGALATTAAIAGSSVSNRVDQTIISSIDDGSIISAAEDVLVGATVDNSINTNVVSGSGSSGFSLAGSIATVHVDSEVTARIGDSVAVDAGQNVIVESIDHTTIDSLAGTGAIGIAAAGVGASVSTVQVHKNTLAYIGENSNVSAATDMLRPTTVYDGEYNSAGDFLSETIFGVAVQATSNQEITNLSATGGVGLYAGVAGAVTVEVISPHVEAWIGKNSVVDANHAGIDIDPNDPNHEKQSINVNVSAVSNLTVNSTDGAGAVGAAGIAGAVDVGKVDHFVWAHIDADAEVSAYNDVDLHGLSQIDVKSAVGAVGAGVAGLSGSVSVWNIGSEFDSDYWIEGVKSSSLDADGTTIDVFASDATSVTTTRRDTFNNTQDSKPKTLKDDLHSKDGPSGVIATVKQGAEIIAGDDIDVRAREWMLVDNSAGGVGVGIAGVGASVALVNVHSDTEANVYGIVAADDDIFVQASLEEVNNTRAWAGQGGLGAIGASVAIVNESSDQTARVAQDATVVKADQLKIKSDVIQDIKTKTNQAVLGLGTVGASVSKINATGTTEAYISDSTIGLGKTPAGGDHPCDAAMATVNTVVVKTNGDIDLESKATAIDAGIVSGAGTIAKVNATPQFLTWVGNGSHLQIAEKLSVNSNTLINGTTDALGVSPLNGVSYGVAISKATVQPIIRTHLGEVNACVGTDVAIQSNNISNATSEGQAVTIAVVNGNGLIANSFAKPDARTWLGNRTTQLEVGRDVLVASNVTQNAETDAHGLTVALVGGGVIRSLADASGYISTEVGRSVDLVVGNNLSVISTVDGDADAFATAPGGGIFNFFGTRANSHASFDSNSMISSVSNLDVGGDTLVEAISNRKSNAEINAFNLSVGAAIGATKANAYSEGKTIASITGQINQTNDLMINANDTNITTARAKSTAIGLVSGAGVKSKVHVNPVVTSELSSTVNSAGNIAISSNSDSKVQAHAQTLGVSGAGAGRTESTVEATPNVTSRLGANASVTAFGDLNISADQSLNTLTGGTASVTGEGGQIGIGLSGLALNLDASANPLVTAKIQSGASVVDVQDLTVTSSTANQLSALDKSFSIGGLLSGGKSKSNVQSGGVVTSAVNGAIGKVDDVTISASATGLATAESTAGSYSLGIGLGGANTNTTVDHQVASSLNSDVSATGDVTVVAESIGDANSNSKGVVGSLAVGVGNTTANSTVNPSAESKIGPRTNVHSAGNITVESRHNVDDSGNRLNYGADSKAESANVAVGVGVQNTKAIANSKPILNSVVDNSASLHAGSGIDVTSNSFSDSKTDADGFVFGLVAAVGSIRSEATSDGSTKSTLNNIDSAIADNGDINIVAESRSNADANAKVGNGSAVAGVNAATSTATSAPVVLAHVDSHNPIETERTFDVNVFSDVSGDVTSAAKETGVSLVFNTGSVKANANWEPTAKATVGNDTPINSGGDISIKAYSNYLDNGNADTDRNVIADTTSRGGALFGGRVARSNVDIRPVVHAQIGGGAEIDALYDFEISARSNNILDLDATTKLIGLAGVSKAFAHADVWISTRAETLPSTVQSTIVAGGDIDFDTQSILTADAYSKAKAPTPFAFRKASSIINTHQLDTVSIAHSVDLNATNDLTVYAEKIKNANATAVVTLGSSTALVNDISISTAASIHGSSPFTLGNTLLINSDDPIISKAKAIILDDTRVSKSDFESLLKQGHINAVSSINTNALVFAQLDSDIEPTSGKQIKVIAKLRKLKTDAIAKFKTKRKGNFDVQTSEKLNLTVVADFPFVKTIKKTFTQSPDRALKYTAKIIWKAGRSRGFNSLIGSNGDNDNHAKNRPTFQASNGRDRLGDSTDSRASWTNGMPNDQDRKGDRDKAFTDWSRDTDEQKKQTDSLTDQMFEEQFSFQIH
ncbi:MAG: hypothetical protein OSA89_12505 [Mariniblastus sp.]|nr:hypothetical protein [Mariniblastus sp.]